jgi:hypothetical protein
MLGSSWFSSALKKSLVSWFLEMATTSVRSARKSFLELTVEAHAWFWAVRTSWTACHEAHEAKTDIVIASRKAAVSQYALTST